MTVIIIIISPIYIIISSLLFFIVVLLFSTKIIVIVCALPSSRKGFPGCVKSTALNIAVALKMKSKKVGKNDPSLTRHGYQNFAAGSCMGKCQFTQAALS